jgi:uncharacterized protein (TIGR00645 family)
MDQLIERAVLNSRWLQVPLYFGLIAVLLILVVKFGQELAVLSLGVWGLEEAGVIHTVLTLVDIMLVANLVIMIAIAGYDNFVSRIADAPARTKLAWLGKIESGSIETKVATSIVLISGIHLLGAFINYERVSNDKLVLLLAIHLAFVVSAVLIALVGYLIWRARPGTADGTAADR